MGFPADLRIKRRDIANLLDKIERGELKSPTTGKRLEGGASMSHHVLAEIRRMFNWYVVRDDDFTSPIVRGMARIKAREQARARVLTDDEIRAVWKALGDMPRPFCAALRFLLLTGQRRSEAAEMVRGEVDANGLWTIPAARYKTKLDHMVPLTPAARAILDEQPVQGEIGLIFTTDGKVAYNDWNGAQKRLAELTGIRGWTIHDLRRTAHTLMTRFGVSHFDADRVLGHVIPGVGGTYNRHDYLNEKRRALETLASAIDRS